MKRPLEGKDTQKIQIEVLDELAGFCKKNDLTYYILFGTLLGAVRHKGFIPWDDDIDVVMPRKDYERFIEIYSDPTGRFTLSSMKNDPEFPYVSAKLFASDTEIREYRMLPYRMGVFIDVFPLDDVGSDLNKIKKMVRRLKTYGKFVESLVYDNSFLRSPAKRVGIAITQMVYGKKDKGRFLRKLADLPKALYTQDSEYCGVYVASWGAMKHTFKKSWFEPSVELEFEGKKYNAPKEYDKVLGHLYGDYMQLPPESERVSHHTFDVWRIEE